MLRSKSTSWLVEGDMDRAPAPAVSLLRRPKISGGGVPEPISMDDILRASMAAYPDARAQMNVIFRLQNALNSRRRLAEPSPSALPLATRVLQANSEENFTISTETDEATASKLYSHSTNCLVSIYLTPGGFSWCPISSESVGDDLPMINDNNLDNMLLITWEAMMASMAAPHYLVPHPVAIVPCRVASLVATLARAHNLYWEHREPIASAGPGEEPVFNAEEPNTSTAPLKQPVFNVSQAPERSLLKKRKPSKKRLGLKKPTSASKLAQETGRVSTKEPIPELSSEDSEEDITPPDSTDSPVSSDLDSFMADLETDICSSQMVQSESGIPKHAVIAFVEEIERAHQYFMFKEHIRKEIIIITHASLADDISYELTWQNELKQDFPLVEEDDIYDVVHRYILELEAKHRKVKNNVKAKDLYAINNAIHYLLFRTREEGYMLDEKPEKELEMLKKFAPLTYSECSAPWEPPVDVKARTAIVSNISLEVSGKDLRLFFRSFGCIKNFVVERMSDGQIAHVTYKDLEGVANLKTYRGYRLPKLSKRTESGYAPLLVHVNSVHDDNSEKKAEDIGELYSEALVKYDEIRKHYGLPREDGKVSDTEKWWGSCQWMAQEWWANGGYTVCGKYVRRPGIRGTRIRRRLRVIGMGKA